MIWKLSTTINWLRLTKPNIMMARKIKQQVADSNLASKLRSSNIFQTFDPKQEGEKLQFISKPHNNPLKGSSLGKKHQLIQRSASIQNDSIPEQVQTYKTKDNMNPLKDQHKKKINKLNINTLSEVKQQSIKNALSADVKTKSPLESTLFQLGKILDPLDPKQLRNHSTQEAAIMQNKQLQQAIAQMKELKIKDFSILVHRLLVNSSGHTGSLQKCIWKQIQQDFLRRFEITTDPNKIRSYSKIIYSLSKSKIHRNTSSSTVNTSVSTNLQSLETKFALLLPSCTHQSYTTILTSLSRMGPLSEQFSYIAQRLYYSKYNEFNARQRVQINYALTRNSRQVDSKLYQYIDSMNLKQIVTMLRCYQNCNNLADFKPDQSNHPNLLSFTQKHIVARKNQMNVIDIGEICNIYFEAMADSYQVSPELERVLTEMYKILKRNINDVAFEKIWKHLPAVVNRGYLQVEFVEQIMKTLQIMRKKDIFPQRIWKPLRQSFGNFQNLQLRARLQKIK